MIRSAIAKLQIFFLSVAFFTCAAAFESPQSIDPARLVGEFQLEDQYGGSFGVEQFKGQWSMVFVGFTSCPDVCPVTLANLEAVRAEMGFRMSPERIPNIVFLAVDPDRDRSVLKDYLAYFHPQYVGITGREAEINKLIKSLGEFYRLDRKSVDEKNYNGTHTAIVSIINPEAKLVANISPPFPPPTTGEYLIQLINEQMRLIDKG